MPLLLPRRSVPGGPNGGLVCSQQILVHVLDKCCFRKPIRKLEIEIRNPKCLAQSRKGAKKFSLLFASLRLCASFSSFEFRIWCFEQQPLAGLWVTSYKIGTDHFWVWRRKR